MHAHHLTAHAVLLALSAGMVTGTAGPAAADPHPDDDGVEVSAQPRGYILTGEDGGSPGATVPAGARAGSARVTCSYTPWAVNGMENGGLEWVDPGSNPNGGTPGRGAYYLVECSDGYRDVLWLRDAPNRRRVTPEQLARQAWALIAVGAPRVRTAPPRGSAGLGPVSKSGM